MSQNGGEGKEGEKKKFSFGGLQKPIQPIGGKGLIGKKSNEIKPIAKLNAFGGGDDDDEPSDKQEGSSILKKTTKPIETVTAKPSKSARAQQDAALSIDSSIFNYDEVYDSMKQGQEAVMKRRQEEDRNRDPKYMSASIAASEQRRLDRQIAEAKKIQREREVEGDLYENTESFVTEAYKQQMEEMQKLDKIEKEKEKNSMGKGKGVAQFYQNLLKEQDLAHQAAVEASLQVKDDVKKNSDVNSDEENEENRKRSRVEEARQKGLDVRTNDDNEVIDERSLLSAGLNTFASKNKKPRIEDDSHHLNKGHSYRSDGLGKSRHDSGRSKELQRERQSRLIEEQMLALQQKNEEEQRQQDAERKKSIVGQRRNDSDRIEQARQRALQRRKKREEEESARSVEMQAGETG